MKIIESSDTRLVARKRAVGGYIVGAVMVLVALGASVYGFIQHQNVLGLIGLGVLVVGVLVIVFVKSELLVADKGAKTIDIMMKGLTGQKQASYSFDQIASVRAVQVYRQTSSSSNTGAGSGISFGTGGVAAGGGQMELQTTTQLVMTDGTNVTVEETSAQAGGGMLLGVQANDGIGQALATFIGKPYQLIAPNMNPVAAVGEVVSAIRGAMSTKAEAPSVAPVPEEPKLPAAPAVPAAPQTTAPVAPPAPPSVNPATPEEPTPPAE